MKSLIEDAVSGKLSIALLSDLLNAGGKDQELLFKAAAEIKRAFVGNKVYLRGLLEYSNKCRKNCFYCGVRASNTHIKRYSLTKDEVVEAAKYAYNNGFASMVLQSGERNDQAFVDEIEDLLKSIHKHTSQSMHITLSMGEQSREAFSRWRKAGAHRYLLRIEASEPSLYEKIHPKDSLHSYEVRKNALTLLRETGYQVGTGVMIGLPWQEKEHLAADLLFIKEMDIDMVGMGPYVEHELTPLYEYRHLLLPPEERFFLSMRMIALLRIIMKDINIAATTAMQTIFPHGRRFAVKIGANVIMPNLTPLKYREDYLLYENKPGLKEEAEDSLRNLKKSLAEIDHEIAFGEWGDALHYQNRMNPA